MLEPGKDVVELVQEREFPKLYQVGHGVIAAEDKRGGAGCFRGAERCLCLAVGALDPFLGGEHALVEFQVHLVVPGGHAVGIFVKSVEKVIGGPDLGVSQFLQRKLLLDLYAPRAVPAVSVSVKGSDHGHEILAQMAHDLRGSGQVICGKLVSGFKQVAGLFVASAQRSPCASGGAQAVIISTERGQFREREPFRERNYRADMGQHF